MASPALPKTSSCAEHTARPSLLAALGWSFGGQAVVRVLALAQTIVLARLLGPAIWGPWVLALALFALLRALSELDWARAWLVEADGDERTLASVWTADLVRRGLLLAVAALLVSVIPLPLPPWMLLACALAFLLEGLRHPGAIAAEARLDFATLSRQQVIAGLAALFVLLTALCLYHGAGLLAIRQVAGGLALALTSFFIFTGRPVLRLERKSLQRLLPFAGRMPVVALSVFAVSEGIVLILGQRFEPASLGTFAMALALVHLPYAFIMSAASPVLLPALSGRASLPRELGQLALAVVLVYLALGLGARLYLPLLLGPDWLPAADFLPALAVYGGCRCLSQLAAVIQFSRHRVALETRIMAVEVIAVLAGTLVLTMQGSLAMIAPCLALVFATGLLVRLVLLRVAEPAVEPSS